VIAEKATSRSVRERMRTRMQILAMESRLGRTVREEDAALAGSTIEQVRDAMEKHVATWEEIQAMRDEMSVARPFPDGDTSCLVHDEPVFGEHNPPEPDEYLYHYTRAWTLPMIRRDRSLRFQPLLAMNDPQEALDSHALMTGLRGPPGEPLQITQEEDALFKSTDWIAEINSARRDVKIGSYCMDVRPDLADVDTRDAEYTVPRRLAANRGWAHPRMWAQYGDQGRGVCLVLNYELLKQAVAESVGDRWPWGYGAVNYGPIEHELSLGFFDIRDLLHAGVGTTLLKNFEESLLTKHADWAHEAEFRFFVMDGSPDALFVPVTKDVIVGVILGPEFDAARHLRNVRAFAETFGVSQRVRWLQWTHGRAELGRVQLMPRVRPIRVHASLAAANSAIRC
jgi:Protein of unknown function (DUF2971)